jgi:hypothetical protein
MFQGFKFFVGGGGVGAIRELTKQLRVTGKEEINFSSFHEKEQFLWVFTTWIVTFASDLQNGGLSMLKPICEFIGCQLKKTLQSAIKTTGLLSKKVTLMLW